MCSVHWSCWSPPGVPSARYGSPSRATSVGESVVRGRLPGSSEFGEPLLEPEHLRARARGRSRARGRPARPTASRRSASPRPCSRSGRRRRGGPCRPSCPRVSARRLPPLRTVSESKSSARQPGLAAVGCARAKPPTSTRPPTSCRRSSAYARESSVVERDVDEVGVAVPGLAVGEGELRALGHRVHVLGERLPERGEVEALEQAQLLQEDRRLAPRPGLQHRDAVVVDGERRLVTGRASRADRPRRAGRQCRSPELSIHRALGERDERLGDEAAVPRVVRGVDLPVAIARAGLGLVEHPPIRRSERRVSARASPGSRHRQVHRRPTSSTRRGRAPRRCGSRRRSAAASDSRPPRSRSRSEGRRAAAACRSRAASRATRRTPPARRPRAGRCPGRARARARRGSARSSRAAAPGPARRARRARRPPARAARAGRRPGRSGAARRPAA